MEGKSNSPLIRPLLNVQVNSHFKSLSAQIKCSLQSFSNSHSKDQLSLFVLYQLWGFHNRTDQLRNGIFHFQNKLSFLTGCQLQQSHVP